MKLKTDCKYDMIIPTSMGVRITPADRQPVALSTEYRMQATSAESNVGNVPAALGMRVKILTKFVKDSSISAFIRNELRKRNLEFEGAEVPQGGPWGYRHQFNIADTGFGVRGPVVQNDRAGEVGCTMSASDFDLHRILLQEGAKIVHISGLFAAMSPDTAKFCLEYAKMAKEAGSLISFDLNYRASFWKGRETELSEIFHTLASCADILVGNEEDFQLALGIQGPEAGGKDLLGKIDSFQEMIENAKKKYPNASVFATTLRQVISANEHLWGAMMNYKNAWYVERPREIPILDRIGGGDAFVSGLLYGILKAWSPEKWLQFGWATGALATTMLEDYATPTSEEQVWSVFNGNARIKR